MSTQRELDGKIALVTGGSRGIGKAISLELGQRGASIAFNYLRSHTTAKETEGQLGALGVETLRHRANLADVASIDDLLAAVGERFGRIDILVNNAASGVMRTSLQIEEKHWDWTHGINAKAPWLLTSKATPLMSSGARVVNISSPGSGRVLPSYFAVGVSKAALEAVTRYMAIDLAPMGISVNAVSAGFVETDALDAFPDELGIKQIASRPTPAGRNVTPVDVAKVVALLCSDEADMIRGQTIVVDGGEMSVHR